jgi:ubiquinone/menaquinone biosynthesis C-methylase UbiE
LYQHKTELMVMSVGFGGMIMASHEARVERQFGAVATAYLSSSVHAQGEDLIAVGSRLQGRSTASVLDLGSGAGHLSFAMAPNVYNVIAYDLSRDMLSTVAEEAKRRGLDNISIKQGSAEALPFSDANFDYVCTRYSAHHWTNIHVALREIRRVLKPNGAVIIIDVCAPEAPLLDTHLQSVELFAR